MNKKNLKTNLIKIISIVTFFLLVGIIKSSGYTPPSYVNYRIGTIGGAGGPYSGFYSMNGGKHLGDLSASHWKLGGTYVPFFYPGSSGKRVNYPDIGSIATSRSDIVVTVNNGMVYCSNNRCTTREGKFDTKIYWIANEKGKIDSFADVKTLSQAISDVEAKVRAKAVYILEGANYATESNSLPGRTYTNSEYNSPGAKHVFRINKCKCDASWINNFNASKLIYVMDKGAPYLATDDGDGDMMMMDALESAKFLGESYSAKIIRDFYNELDGSTAKAWTIPDHSLNGGEAAGLSEFSIDGLGPKVTVVESSNYGKGDTNAAGYTFDLSLSGPPGLMYALTGMRKLYDASSPDYDPCDIQEAWWILVDSPRQLLALGDGSSGSGYGNARGDILANEAIAYNAYSSTIPSIPGRVSVNLNPNGKTTEVIIDQKTQTYTAGPFSISYPNYKEFIYVKQLVLETSGGDSNATLYYNENVQDFKILYPNGSTSITGSNGLKQAYPLFDNLFYVQFTVAKVGHPTKLKLTGDVEYLYNASISARVATGGTNKAVTYAYIAHYSPIASYNNNNANSDDKWDSHKCTGSVPIIVVFFQRSKETRGSSPGQPYIPESGGYIQWYFANEYGTWIRYGIAYSEADIPPGAQHYKVPYDPGQPYIAPKYWFDYSWQNEDRMTLISYEYWFQPWVKMSRKACNTTTAQSFTHAGTNGSRTYKVVTRSTELEFTMDIEGTVFEDVRKDKTNLTDGRYTTDNNPNTEDDKGMQGVIVLLYRHDLGGVGSLGDNTTKGTFIRAVKTNSQGKFAFTKLNEMYKYHVEYIYNGQYYEPTKCTTKVTYNSGTNSEWNIISKAIDDNAERDRFNQKFEEVGSTNRNVIAESLNGDSRVYKYKSGTREELEKAKAIDANANLRGATIDGSGYLRYSSNNEYAGYAYESMIRAYTARDSGNRMIFDLYPFEHVFVANYVVNPPHEEVVSGIKPLYGTSDDNKNLVKSINLGLMKREEIDFALQKDVFQVIFELNGKKYIYRYNTRFAPIPEGKELEEYDEGMLTALQYANKSGYAVDTRLEKGYTYYKELDYRHVYREDYEYNGNMYKQLRVQNADGKSQPITYEEYRELIEAKRKGELEIYVKYRITLANFSSGLNGSVTEIVDHSDTEFTLIGSDKTIDGDGKVVQGEVLQREVDAYRPYIGTGLKGEVISDKINDLTEGKAEEQFGAMITKVDNKYVFNEDKQYLTTSKESIYKDSNNGQSVEMADFEANNQYNTTYITGMEDVYLTNKFNNVDLYVTYRVNKLAGPDGEQYLIIDERVENLPITLPNNNPKSNLAEIRGYKTYYSKSAYCPNRNNNANNIREEFKKGENRLGKDDTAGILDSNSTPGNLKYAEREFENENKGIITNEIINVAKENDADRAPLLRIILNMEQTREVNGSTFEDERTESYNYATYGDGKFETEKDKAINGIRVQLVELVKNGNQPPIEIIWKEVKAGDKEELYPVIDQFGLIGTYNLENTYMKDKDGKTNTLPTGLVDGDKDEEDNWKVDNDTTGNYRILGFPTGDFIVRFIYGSDSDTVVGHKGYNYNKVTYEKNEIEILANEDKRREKLLDTEYDTTSEIRKTSTPASTNIVPTPANIYSNAKYYYRNHVLGYLENDNYATNEKSYTGNDYKSTTYRNNYYELPGNIVMYPDPNRDDYYFGLEIEEEMKKSDVENIILDYQPKKTGEYEFNFYLNDIGGRLSDARDIYSRRQEVIDYSNNDQINHIAEVLASFEEKQKAGDDEIRQYLEELFDKTYMYADSGVIHVNTEYNSTEKQMIKDDHDVANNNAATNGFFTIANLDFGLEERPKAQLKTTVQVANLKITLANGNVLFDAKDTATNLQWQHHLAHGEDVNNEYKGSMNYYDVINDPIDPRDDIKSFMKIPVVRQSGNNGIILPTMDQELQQGAKVEITYIVSVANIGEVDFYQTDTCRWYNKHNTDYLGHGNVVRTKAKELVCYVGTQTVPDLLNADNIEVSRNNLKFSEEDNKRGNNQIWEVIKEPNKIRVQEPVKDNSGRVIGYNDLVNEREAGNIKKYDYVIHTTKNSYFYDKELMPLILDDEAPMIRQEIESDPLHATEKTMKLCESVVGEKLVLTSTLSGDLTTNNMTFNNLVEIVKIDNDVGRRMAFSILGNQNPIHEPNEIDADLAEEISIIPPFGDTQFDYYLGFSLAGIMILGGLLVMIYVKKKA